MPTRSEPNAPPDEVGAWQDIVSRIFAVSGDGGPSEVTIVEFFDARADLDRRARKWGFTITSGSAGEVASLAGGLAVAEHEARTRGDADIALRAFTERRNLVGDRLVHWVVPWLTAASSGPGDVADLAARDLLAVADYLRPAPAGSGGEGLHPPGEDAFGPIEDELPPDQMGRSLWSGLAGGVESRLGAGDVERFEAAAERWHNLADAHAGTAALWVDLEARARRTAIFLKTLEKP